MRFTPFLSSLLPLPGLLLYSNLLSLAPGVLSCLAHPWRLVSSCSSLASRLVSFVLSRPGVSSGLARPWRLTLYRSPPVSLLVLSCPRRRDSSRFASASCLNLLALGVSFHLARSRRLVSLATSILSRLARPPRLVLSCSLPVWSRLPPALLVWSGLARPGVLSGLARLRRLVLSCSTPASRLALESMLYWSATWDNVFPDVPYFPKKHDDFHIPPFVDRYHFGNGRCTQIVGRK